MNRTPFGGQRPTRSGGAWGLRIFRLEFRQLGFQLRDAGLSGIRRVVMVMRWLVQQPTLLQWVPVDWYTRYGAVEIARLMVPAIPKLLASVALWMLITWHLRLRDYE